MTKKIIKTNKCIDLDIYYVTLENLRSQVNKLIEEYGKDKVFNAMVYNDTVEFFITLERKETDTEYSNRLVSDANAEKYERAQLKRLQEKYG